MSSSDVIVALTRMREQLPRVACPSCVAGEDPGVTSGDLEPFDEAGRLRRCAACNGTSFVPFDAVVDAAVMEIGKLSAEVKRLRELAPACEIVERFARSIGRDVEVIFMGDSTGEEVQVAPLGWGGGVVSTGLFAALTEAKEEGDEG